MIIRDRNTGRRAAILVLTALIALIAAAHRSHAEVIPAHGAGDARIRVATYAAEQVYRLHGFVGYQIDLEFEAGETFVGLGAGDIDALAFAAQGNHLFLKPKAGTVATNLTVLTNRRHYQFEYTASGVDPAEDQVDVVYALRFTYPADPATASAARETEGRHIDASLSAAEEARPKNFDYWYCGDAALRPVMASDDGIHTRLRFAANAELPAIFARAEDDSESLLNTSIDAGDVIVHRIARRFILRRGQLTGCLVNKAFAGSGARLGSGTVTPQVERRIRGANP